MQSLEPDFSPVIIFNSQWQVHYVSQAAQAFLLYSQVDSIVGLPLFSLFPKREKKHLDNIQLLLRDHHELPQKRLHHLLRDGSIVEVLTQFSRIPGNQPNDQFMYIETLRLPVDVWKQQLTGFKILADNVPGLEMLLVDSDLQIQCRIGSESQKKGWAGQEDQKNLLKYLSPTIAKILNPLLNIAFEFTPVSREFVFGKEHYSVRLIPLKSKESIISVVIILQNISETKLVEKKLIISKKEAEQANEAKDIFIAKMSHEIRTPLNAIMGFTEQLKKTRLTKKQAAYLDIVFNSSTHLLSIIDDILIVSKIESGEVELEKIPFKAGQVLQAVGALFELKYLEKKLSYKSSCEKNADQPIIGDPSRLQQILINLVNNAIKFTPQGSIHVGCSLVEVTKDALTLNFRVVDSGIGIAAQDMGKIFEPFHQVDNSMGRHYSGAGLGLTICKDLIETMGGVLKVKSSVGGGSVFSFCLTFPKAPNRLNAQPLMLNKYVKTKSLAHLRVLFVDDDPANRLLGKIVMQQLSIKPTFAESGQQAIKLFRPGKFHLVLLDINMSDVNGVDVAYHIRKMEQTTDRGLNTKILAMTANALRKDVRKYHKAGMDSVILKPFSEDDLYEQIIKLTREYEIKPSPLPAIGNGELKNGAIDLKQLANITHGNTDFMILMLNVFIENSSALVKQIEDAWAKHDYATIAEAAHRLHPSTEQLGIKRATRLLKQMENQFLKKKNFQDAPQLIRSTLMEIRRGLKDILLAREGLEGKSLSGSVH